MVSSMTSTCTFLDPCLNGDSSQDLQCKLMYTSLELQKVLAEGQLQETELWRLQKLLNIMQKERDEAREECKRLQECVLLQHTPPMGVDSASSFMHSSSMVSSPSSSPWSLQELEEHLNSDDFCETVSIPAPSQLQQALESLVQGCSKGQPAFSHMKPGNVNVLCGLEHGIQMEISEQALSFNASPCLNLPELPAKDEIVSTVSSSARSLSRQSSSNSSSASVQQFQKGHIPLESLHAVVGRSSGMAKSVPAVAMAAMTSNAPLPPLSMGSNAVYDTTSRGSSGLMTNNMNGGSNGSSPNNHNMSPNLSTCDSGASMAMDASSSKLCNGPPMHTSAASLTPGNSDSLSLACMLKGVAYPTTSAMVENVAFPTSVSLAQALPTRRVVALTSTPMPSACAYPQATPVQMRQLHLPEPPEADPQVMLNSLPEKGKLLQAVMEAGPLLQTLLLAGPLPQWRYPPPALSNQDIPKVSLAPGHVFLPPSSMQGAVAFMSNGSPSDITSKRVAVLEPGLQNKKLRKLSPSPSRKGQTICSMLSGGESQGPASGSWSQLAAS